MSRMTMGSMTRNQSSYGGDSERLFDKDLLGLDRGDEADNENQMSSWAEKSSGMEIVVWANGSESEGAVRGKGSERDRGLDALALSEVIAGDRQT